MKYVALLRGINAGKLRRVEMKRLKNLFEVLGYSNVTTYINSGNVIFESNKNKKTIHKHIESNLIQEFGFEIPVLIKTQNELIMIASAIPKSWQNNSNQRTDIAYLFEDIDSPDIIDKLPLNKEYVDVRYVKGAVIWNIDRKNYNKSYLNKIVNNKIYKSITIRNVNTARFLASIE